MVVIHWPEYPVRFDVSFIRKHVKFRILKHSKYPYFRILDTHIPIALDAVQNKAEIERHLVIIDEWGILAIRLAALSPMNVYVMECIQNEATSTSDGDHFRRGKIWCTTDHHVIGLHLTALEGK